MRSPIIVAIFFLLPIAFCQRQNAESTLGAEAAPSELSISCHIDPDTQTVSVTLVNQSPRRIHIQYLNNVDARSNYEVIVTDQKGSALPKTPAPPVPVGPGIRVVYEASGGPIIFDPQQQRVETFPLSTFSNSPRG
jgi:hypothetical protein